MVGQSQDNRDTQRLKGFADHCLLALIHERPMYGFELISAMEESRVAPRCARGTIYPLLSRMEEQGLITGREEIGATNRRRRYYEILPKGEARLLDWNEQWSRFRDGMDSVVGRNRV